MKKELLLSLIFLVLVACGHDPNATVQEAPAIVSPSVEAQTEPTSNWFSYHNIVVDNGGIPIEKVDYEYPIEAIHVIKLDSMEIDGIIHTNYEITTTVAIYVCDQYDGYPLSHSPALYYKGVVCNKKN